MIRSYLSRILTNLPGWRTNRKIVVIESDDWGSIRMPSKQVFEKCLKAGYPVDKIAYERYDSLASEKDLELIFDTLTSFRDKHGNHPVITANCVTANPDFDRIRADNYKNYYYELITDTFYKYPNHSGCFKLWLEGKEAGIFYPQYHCREHLNVSLFMDALRKGDRDAKFGFDHKMAGCISMGPEVRGNNYMEPTRYNSIQDKKEKLSFFIDGLDLFEILFGYKSASVIPPNYIWSPDFNEELKKKEVIYYQGIKKMYEPVVGGKSKSYSYYLGKKNNFGQTYLLRNALFEPSLFRLRIKDPVDHCLADMAVAFRMKKPAVICSHRINYVGSIEEANRDKTLKLLKVLLSKALEHWPEIEFITSVQLGQLINSKKDT